MSWGVYRLEPDDEGPEVVHVAPCTPDGVPAEGHELTEDCWCGPEWEAVAHSGFWSHLGTN